MASAHATDKGSVVREAENLHQLTLELLGFLPCHLRTAAFNIVSFFLHLVFADFPLETNYPLPVGMLN